MSSVPHPQQSAPHTRLLDIRHHYPLTHIDVVLAARMIEKQKSAQYLGVHRRHGRAVVREHDGG